MKNELIEYIRRNPFRAEVRDGDRFVMVNARVILDGKNYEILCNLIGSTTRVEKKVTYEELLWEIEIADSFYYGELVEKFKEYFV